MLDQVLSALPPLTDPRVRVGPHTGDDAAVYDLDGTRALVATVDVFTPILDDPYSYGQVAAANSLSDVYAMGGRPLFALSLIGFPTRRPEGLPDGPDAPPWPTLEDLAAIIRGAADKAREAGVDIVGGHSWEDAEPKCGLSVTGEVELARLTRRDGARAGDQLVLTKPLGSGILTTAIKRGWLDDERTATLTRILATLNRAAAEAMVAAGARACTDVTGFGLLGHLAGMVQGQDFGAHVAFDAVPLMDGVREMQGRGAVPGGTRRNAAYYGPRVRFAERIAKDDRLLLFDAQSSGGLLIAIAPEKLDDLLRALEQAGVPVRAHVGEFRRDIGPGRISVG